MDKVLLWMVAVVVVLAEEMVAIMVVVAEEIVTAEKLVGEVQEL